MKMKVLVKEDSITTTTNKNDNKNGEDRWSAISKMVETTGSDLPSTSQLINSPPITALDSKDKGMYGVRPLEQMSQNIIKCTDCGKPVLENALEAHTINCQLIRDNKQKKKDADQISRKRGVSEVSDTNPSPPKKSVTSFTLTHNKSTSSIPSLSKKDRGKQRAAIVDVDIHCGVMLEKGYPCSRSLTCKTHSMGSKRSVPGRSQSYDILLNNWQKASKGEDYISGTKKSSQPRIGGTGITVSGSVGGSGKKKRKNGLNGGIGEGTFGGKDSQGRERRMVREKGKNVLVVGEWEEEEVEEVEGMLMDSDEEVEKVMEALQRGGIGKPLDGLGASGNNRSLFSGRNNKLARLRTVLGGVFGKM